MQKTTQCLTSTFKLFPFSDGRVMVTASCPPDKRPLSGLWSKVGATAIKSCQRSLVDGLMWNSLLFKSMIKFHSIDKFIGKWSIVIVEAPTWMWKHLDRVPAWLWEVFQKQVGWGTWLPCPRRTDAGDLESGQLVWTRASLPQWMLVDWFIQLFNWLVNLKHPLF